MEGMLVLVLVSMALDRELELELELLEVLDLELADLALHQALRLDLDPAGTVTLPAVAWAFLRAGAAGVRI
jgi:hypothetical protein